MYMCKRFQLLSEYPFIPSTAGSDYTATTETRTFAAGATVQCISVPTILDGVNEVTECFNVNIASTQAGVTLNPATVQVCIEDNDRTSCS